MNADNGAENFVIEIDNSKLEKDAQRAASLIEGIGDAAVRQGERLDKSASELPRLIEELNKAYEEQKRTISDLDKQILEHKQLQELDKKEVQELKAAYEEAKKAKGEYAAQNEKKAYEEAQKAVQAEADAIKQLNLNKQEYQHLNRQTIESIKEFRSEAYKIPTVNEQIAESMKTVAKLSLGYLSYEGANKFIAKAAEVRSEIEMLQTQMDGLFGEDAGGKIFSGLKEMALNSGIYKTTGLSQAAETLKVYGEETEDILPLMQQFGDVAMGNDQKLQSLANAFGRVTTQGNLSSLTLRTMIRAGFNPLDEMARTTGKSMQQLRQEMSNGQITVDRVREALKSATSEGGKYYNMTEKLSGSIKGEQQRLASMIAGVYAKFGEEHEDLIKSSLKLRQALVAHYEDIGKAIAMLVGTYGTYRAAVIANGAVEAAMNAHYVTKIRLLRLAAVAQAAFNRVLMMNPYVLAATALGGLITAVVLYSKKSAVAEEAAKRWNEREKEQTEQHEKRKNKLNELLSKINDETASEYEQQEAFNELGRMMPNLTKHYNSLIELQKHFAEATAMANEQLQLQNAIQTGTKNYNNDKEKLALLKKYRDSLGKIGMSDEKDILKKKLLQKYPELFSDDEEQQKDMRRNPGIYKSVSFKGQGTFETDWHAVNAEITAIAKDIKDKTVKKLQSTLATAWDSSLARKSDKELDENLAFYEKELKRFQNANKTSIKRTRTKNGMSEEVVKPKNPKDFIAFKDSMGNTILLTEDEVKRRIKKLKAEKNVSANNRGRDYLKEAQDELRKKQEAERRVIANRKKYRTAEAYEADLNKAKLAVKDAQATVDRREQDKGLKSQDRKGASERAKAAREAKLQAEREDKAQNKITEEQYKYARQTAKRAEANELLAQQAVVDAMAEGSKKKLAQLDIDHKKELAAIDEEARQLYEAKVEHQKELWEADTKNEGKGFWTSHKRDANTGLVSGVDALTEEESKGVKAKRQSENVRYGKEVQETLRQSVDAMIGYYKQFGTLEEQRYAIAKEYDEKIAKAQTDGERRSLEAQKKKDLATAGANSLANEIDWSQTFEGVGNVLGSVAKETLRKVEEYMQTAEYKQLKPSDQKAYADLREKLTKETGGSETSPFNFKQWGAIAQQVKEYQNSVQALQRITEEHRQAVNELQKAEKNLSESTDDASKQVAQAAVDAAQAKVDATGQAKEDAQKAATEKQQQLTDSTSKATNGMRNFTSALQEISGGSLYGFANGITKLITSIGGTSKSLGELGGKVGGIVGAILQILDALGDDPTKFIDDILEKVTNTVEKILADLPNLVGHVIQDVGTLVGSVIEGIGGIFGAKDGWLYGSNEWRVKEVTERLTKSNDALKTSIDQLKDAIDKENGVNAITDTQRALQAQRSVNENQRKMLEENMGMHGKHHSNAYYWGKDSWFFNNPFYTNLLRKAGINVPDGYSKINSILHDFKKRTPTADTKLDKVGSLDDMYKLTPEQMNEIRTQNAELWTHITTVGKYDMSKYWNAYADQAGKTAEIADKLREKLTGITFDSMHDDFVSKLMDMQNKAKDFTKDINKQFAKGLLNFSIGTQMDAKLKEWWKNWADTMQKQSGDLTDTQIDNMRREYEAFVSEGMRIRDKVFKVTGYDKETYAQSSSSASLSGITQDQGQELNGRLSSIQIHVAEIAEAIQQEAERNKSVIFSLGDIRSIMNDLMDLQMQGLNHLEAIERHTSVLPQMNERIDKIRRNTENS